MATAKKPIIFSIDDDPQVLRSIKNDLRNAYKDEYRILSAISAQEALDSLPELKKQGETVALFLSDQRMPEMLGVDFLAQAKTFFPEAKRVLLTAYSDTEAAIRAINAVGLDHYLLKPWDPPQDKLYPVLNDLLDEWQTQHVPEFQGIKVVGYQFAPKSHEIKDFLAGNLFAYQWLDVESDPRAAELLALHGIEPKQLPLVVLENGQVLATPSIVELAQQLGLPTQVREQVYDVAIIGAGPAGLAAAVYGGSEGLRTLLIERRAPGGQAGTSSRIENYLGFPKGLSGADLTHRALTQATRLGAEFLSSKEVATITLEGIYKKIHFSDGSLVTARAVIIATGVDYRKLPAQGAEKFAGAGVYYGAATTEANACRNKEVYIVGGGNSAGQGAVYLSNFAQNVHIVVRRPDLRETMSAYLIDQIQAIPNIQVHGETEIVATLGHDYLECVELEHTTTGERNQVRADALFVFIGTRPATDWLPANILRDSKGFIETGKELKQYPAFAKIWKLPRDPYLLETCQPGIFAAGDVRAGAMNRVASAVGEGAMAVKFVHEYLAEV